jgi:hypothetical protein
MKVKDGKIKWTYALDFKYAEAPMLIDYMNSSSLGHHSLATKDVSSGGFTIARLKLNTSDDQLLERKQIKLTHANSIFKNFKLRGQLIIDENQVLLLFYDDSSNPHHFHMLTVNT